MSLVVPVGMCPPVLYQLEKFSGPGRANSSALLHSKGVISRFQLDNGSHPRLSRVHVRL